MEEEILPKKSGTLCTPTANIVEELREIAFWFSDRGLTDNSKFCTEAADRLEWHGKKCVECVVLSEFDGA